MASLHGILTGQKGNTYLHVHMVFLVILNSVICSWNVVKINILVFIINYSPSHRGGNAFVPNNSINIHTVVKYRNIKIITSVENKITKNSQKCDIF